jgi:UDPglucose--hexose-1-phosphate uridylyltransferase
MAGRCISGEALERITEHTDVSKLGYGELVSSVRRDPEIARFAPERKCQADPRDGTRVVFAPARAARGGHGDVADCPVCSGNITKIVDLVPLSRGFTFVNKNLYPIVYPDSGVVRGGRVADARAELLPDPDPAFGLHLLQWTSSEHLRDFHSMEPEDLAIVIDRLAVLEKTLLHADGSPLPLVEGARDGTHRGWVSIIKNRGRHVGGSVRHGHQQIVHSNVQPRRIREDVEFRKSRGVTFGAYVLDLTPKPLRVARYGDAFDLVVPFFMRRPLAALLVSRETDVEHLHDLDAAGRAALAGALREITYAIALVLRRMHRPFTYNLVFHTGPIGRLYVEILPYTQEMGGFEQLGLFVCQSSPKEAAELYREAITEVRRRSLR